MKSTQKSFNGSVSESVRAEGLESIAQMSRETGVSVITLRNWAANKPKLFKVTIEGVKSILGMQSNEVVKNSIKKQILDELRKEGIIK